MTDRHSDKHMTDRHSDKHMTDRQSDKHMTDNSTASLRQGAGHLTLRQTDISPDR